MGGHDQDARAGRCRVVDIRTGRHERLRRFDVAMARGEEQRRIPAAVPHDALVVLRRVRAVGMHQTAPNLGTRTDIGTLLNQHADGVMVPLRDRPHERGLPTRLLCDVDVGAARRQHAHGVGAARARSGHDRGLASGQRDVGVGAGVEQTPDHRGAPVAGREPERRRTELVRSIDVGAAPDEHLGRLLIVAVGRPVQCRRAIGLQGVDVGAVCQERPHRLRILRLHGVDERDVRRIRPDANHRARQQQGQPSMPSDALWRHDPVVSLPADPRRYRC